MRIFLAGGTGTLGSRLIPKLTAAGHQVTATTRRADRAGLLTRLGAAPAIVDVYDADLLSSVVAAAAPDVILHELTDLSEYDTDANARLRREGTANLIAAAQAAGTGRIVVESIAWIFPDADALATEDDPIISGTAVDAMEGLARRLPHATILRYGILYGPGTWYAPGGAVAAALAGDPAARFLGSIEADLSVMSFLHVADAARAAVAALDWPTGPVNIVDDEPAQAREWLPVLAAALGVPAPEATSGQQNWARGASNGLARSRGWVPEHPTWRSGFAAQQA